MTLFIVVLTIGHLLGSVNSGWLAFLGTIFGGVGLKFCEKWLSRSADKKSSEASERRDLNAEIATFVTRVDNLEKEVEEWRQKYFELQEEFYLLREIIIKNGLVLPDKAAPKKDK